MDEAPDLTLGAVTRVIAGCAPATSVVGRRVPHGLRLVEAFTALPSPRHPRLLIPRGSRGAASVALRQYNNATTTTMRAGAELFGMVIRLGLADRFVGNRLQIVADDVTAGEPSPSFKEFLGSVFPGEELELALRLAPERPNRKTVLQILNVRGRVLGYAKVSSNALNRSLVRNEARVLRRLAECPARPVNFTVPRLLYSGQWAGMEILVVSPLPQRRWRLRPDLRFPLAASKEIAGLPTGRGPLADNEYWRHTRARVAQVAEEAPGPVASALAAAVDHLERRHGDLEVALASWHGDWIPWNMVYAGDGLLVWDWERSGDQVPLGLDAVHFRFHTGVKIEKRPPLEAVRDTVDWAGPVLEQLGVTAPVAPALVALDLVEMTLRYEEARMAGVDVVDRIHLRPLQEVSAWC